MARIFTPNSARESADRWDAVPLEAKRVRLDGLDSSRAPHPTVSVDAPPGPAEVVLLCTGGAGAGPDAAPEPAWAVLAGPDARLHLNGEPLALGIALLRHRDELRLAGGAPLYFSTERTLAVEACPRDDAPRCPRCAQAIGRGAPCVRCPGCGVRHHQTEERPCWTYASTCALCDQATPLDAGLSWTPEES